MYKDCTKMDKHTKERLVNRISEVGLEMVFEPNTLCSACKKHDLCKDNLVFCMESLQEIFDRIDLIQEVINQTR